MILFIYHLGNFFLNYNFSSFYDRELNKKFGYTQFKLPGTKELEKAYNVCAHMLIS